MKDRIVVKKDQIPYGFNIALGNEKFNMRFVYNRQADLFTVSLYRDGVVYVMQSHLSMECPCSRRCMKQGNSLC